MPVIRNPERTKNRKTPSQPKVNAPASRAQMVFRGGESRGPQKRPWYKTTERIAIPRRISRPGMCGLRRAERCALQLGLRDSGAEASRFVEVVAAILRVPSICKRI